MLRLKINLRVWRSVRVKCPRHPRYNPEREGAVPFAEAAASASRSTSYMRASLQLSGAASIGTTHRTMRVESAEQKIFLVFKMSIKSSPAVTK